MEYKFGARAELEEGGIIMETIIIGGFLGTGKTSLILKLVDELTGEYKLAIIENEAGEIGIDGELIREKGLKVSEITSGCICCQVSGSLISTYQFLVNEYRPNLVIIEPTGIAFPSQIKSTVNEYTDFGPIFILVDFPRVYELTNRITPAKNQMKEGEYLLLNKVDLGVEDVVEERYRYLKEKYPGKTVFKISCETGNGIEKVIKQIERSCEAAT